MPTFIKFYLKWKLTNIIPFFPTKLIVPFKQFIVSEHFSAPRTSAIPVVWFISGAIPSRVTLSLYKRMSIYPFPVMILGFVSQSNPEVAISYCKCGNSKIIILNVNTPNTNMRIIIVVIGITYTFIYYKLDKKLLDQCISVTNNVNILWIKSIIISFNSADIRQPF